ncbi:hypothetical protein BM221_005472 [Beauveria bassiana]|uniref:Uncharacterized protein n=1 Tax=Beauveria bassiana TaxID=176275 RepID=A0A2N6NNN1_BEABA|nr:hypothetical protein BM221_005472 [Beauveria bassiana]
MDAHLLHVGLGWYWWRRAEEEDESTSVATRPSSFSSIFSSPRWRRIGRVTGPDTFPPRHSICGGGHGCEAVLTPLLAAAAAAARPLRAVLAAGAKDMVVGVLRDSRLSRRSLAVSGREAGLDGNGALRFKRSHFEDEALTLIHLFYIVDAENGCLAEDFAQE